MKYHLCIFAVVASTLLRAVAEPTSDEMTVFHPEFLFDQREALGLEDSQLQDMQAVMKAAQPRFEKINAEIQVRAAALQAALQDRKPDLDQTEQKLRDLLAQESELKSLQLRTMLALRNQLTDAQLQKAGKLRQEAITQAKRADANPGAAERLGKKFEELKAAVQQRGFTGPPPPEIIQQYEEIQRVTQSDKPLDAERLIDALIARLRAETPKR